jgi:glycosyltransferase involved in cell wall biosynthesis
MRIALLSTGFAPHSVELAAALRRDADVLLVADRDLLERDSPAEELQAFADAGRLATFRRHSLPSRIAACATAFGHIARFRPDVVVAHEHPQPTVAWIHRQMARVAKTLLIVHDPEPHGGVVFSTRNQRSQEIERRSASAFLLHGKYCTATFLRSADPGERPVLTAPLGSNLRPGGEVAGAVEPGRILMFGRMYAYKGLDLLLAAARILKARGVAFHLRLAGDGPDLEPLRQDYLDLGCCSIRSDFLPPEDAVEEFRRAHLVVVPYTDATQSGVVAIAFAFGRPVVATAVGGLPDFVDHEKNGLLVAPNDPVALADALQRALADDALVAAMSAGARVTSATEMNWETVADVVMRGARIICGQKLPQAAPLGQCARMPDASR